jgi:hypothetical protein
MAATPVATSPSSYLPLDHQHHSHHSALDDDDSINLIGGSSIASSSSSHGHDSLEPVSPHAHTVMIEPMSLDSATHTNSSTNNNAADDAVVGAVAVCRIWMITMVLSIILIFICLSISGITRWYTWLPLTLLSSLLIISSIIALRQLRFQCCNVPHLFNNATSSRHKDGDSCLCHCGDGTLATLCSYPCTVSSFIISTDDSILTLTQRRRRLRYMRYIGIIIGSLFICSGIAYFVANLRFMLYNGAPYLILPILFACCIGCCQWLLCMSYHDLDSPPHTLPSSIPPHLLRRLQHWESSPHDGEVLRDNLSFEPPQL